MSLSSEKFYDDLADYYDEMTHFDQRLEREVLTMQLLRDRFKFDSAIDIACGTGLHVCALERIAVPTTGNDISAKMLEKAKQNAKRHNISPNWIHSSMTDLDVPFKSDALFCLGNSIPHLLSEKEFNFVSTKFSALLNKNGILIFQLLNFNSILKTRERIVNIATTNKGTAIRFYDFIDPFIQFNLLTFWKENDKMKHTLNSTLLFPFQKAQIEYGLKTAGFRDIKFYGSLQLETFNDEASKDLVVVATF